MGLEHLDANSPTIRRWGSPEDVGENSDLRPFESGDVILARRGIEQRKVGFATFDGVASGHALVFRARPGVLVPDFLPQFLLSDAFMGRVDQFSAGSLSKTVNLSALLRVEFAVPPLEDQRRMARILSAIERTKQMHIDLIDAAEHAYSAYSAESFRGEGHSETRSHPRLGTVAAEWPVMSIGALTELSQYGLSTAPQDSGAFPILRMMNLVNGQAVENDLRFVDLTPAEFDTYRLDSGDVLFNRTNSIELVGRTGLYRLDGDHVFASYLVRLKLKTERVRPEYIVEYLNAPLGRQQVLSFATKAISQANVSASNLAKVLVPLPPLEVQDRILRDLRRLRMAEEAAHERVRALQIQGRFVRGEMEAMNTL